MERFLMRFWYIPLLLVIGVLYPPVSAYENSIYIWQRTWKPEIVESVNHIKPQCSQFMILAGNLIRDEKHVYVSKVPVNWKYLKDAGVITIDIRMRRDLAKSLQNKDVTSISEIIKNSVSEILNEANASGVIVKGVQIDYDCPTVKLADFSRFVKVLKQKIPNIPLSITALPTWMKSKDFSSLVSLVDYYVLQLHSFEIPKGNDKKQYIFPKDKALGYYYQALAFHKPFYLSLPTYGYEVAYSKDSEFLGLRAEGGVEFIGEGVQHKLMYADPKEIVLFLKSIEETQPDYFKGVCWFRLPITSDHYNWDIKTLERVLKKEIPQGQLKIEISSTPTGVKELYLENTGEMNYSEKVSFDIYWNGTKPIYDILGDFEGSDIPNGKGLHITGMAPRVSQRKMVGWFRSFDKNNISISNSEVSIHEK